MNAHAGLSLLLAEEFDTRPASPPDLDALLVEARAQARAEICAACEVAAARSRQALAGACASLASSLADALTSLDASLTETTRVLAETILAAIRTAMPAWAVRHDRAVMAEIAATLLACLGESVAPRLVAGPSDVAELRGLLPATIALEVDATMARGALRLSWQNGHAVRDPATIWNAIETTLTTALLAPPAESSGGLADDQRK